MKEKKGRIHTEENFMWRQRQRLEWCIYKTVQFSSVTQWGLTLCDPMDCSMPGFLSITNSQSLLKLMSIESVMPSNHLILSHPLLLPPPIFPSIRVFSSESVLCIKWPKYWSFSFSISPSNEYSGLISLKTDFLDLPAVQGTLKSLLSAQAGCMRQVHWEDPEGSGGEGGGRRDQDGEHM